MASHRYAVSYHLIIFSDSIALLILVAGHYALKGWSSDRRPKLLRPVDRLKDQTYFLSAISEAALRRALFPLGHLTKPEVRDLAKQHGLTTAERPDSVGICFVGEKARFNNFLCMFVSK